METNGRFSFLPTSESAPLTPKDMNITPAPTYPVANIVVDGVIMENNLKIFKKDIAWLENTLNMRGVDLKEILLATLNEEYQLNVYYKSGEKTVLSPFD